MVILTPEEKPLIGVYSEQVFGGIFLRQRKPFCCGREIDLYGVPSVRFLDIRIEEEKFTLIGPICPVCGKWVRPSYSIIC